MPNIQNQIPQNLGPKQNIVRAGSSNLCMKKLVLLSAILIGAATASQAGVNLHLGFNLPLPPLPGLVISHPARMAVAAPVISAAAPCEPVQPVYAQTSVTCEQPVVVAPAAVCEPPLVVVTAPPVCPPQRVVVAAPPVIVECPARVV